MSKRVRGTRRSSGARPANRPVRRPAPTTLLAPVNQLVQPAALNAVTATAVQGEAAHAPAPLPRSGPARQSALAARAATEYVYVGQDLRHIAVLASAIGAVLVVLWVLIDVLRLIQL